MTGLVLPPPADPGEVVSYQPAGLALRYGEEIDGRWYPDPLAAGEVESYKAAFRRIVASMRRS